MASSYKPFYTDVNVRKLDLVYKYYTLNKYLSKINFYESRNN